MVSFFDRLMKVCVDILISRKVIGRWLWGLLRPSDNDLDYLDKPFKDIPSDNETSIYKECIRIFSGMRKTPKRVSPKCKIEGCLEFSESAPFYTYSI